ncbi:SatD family protein [Halorarum salinum]|uniref:SatD family (SatD) n=1 Tax=Halorarum salinum TaxID=2743089 RepID=A0A7D5L8K2_9EURY|nr:SatD family protein [Halobaculum salinum]QLG60866.1 hypothetical protein HUG12_03540 [Halobaculum salinum]
MEGDERTYVVLGDVVGSRDVPERDRLRRELRAALAGANDEYGADVGAPFTPLKGVDEFGGTLTGRGTIYGVVRAVQEGLHPTVARYAVVRGEVDVNPDSTDVRTMDGPAFHRADELLADLASGDGNFVVETGDPSVDDLATAAGDLALAVREGWTERQMEVARAYRVQGTQVRVAEEFGVSKQAISKTLRAAQYDRVRRAEERLNRALASGADERGQ